MQVDLRHGEHLRPDFKEYLSPTRLIPVLGGMGTEGGEGREWWAGQAGDGNGRAWCIGQAAGIAGREVLKQSSVARGGQGGAVTIPQS